METIMRGGVTLAAAMIVFGFGPNCGDGGQEPEEATNDSHREAVELEVLANDFAWGEIEGDGPRLEIIESDEALDAMLELFDYAVEGFDVDFSEWVVLSVYAGQQPHDGLEFRFVRAVDTGDRIQVQFSLIDHLVGGDAITHPYVFLKAPRSDKPYELSTRRLRVHGE